jgi:hypothetical protein
VPLIPEDPPAATTTAVMNSLFGVFIDKIKKTPFISFGMNGITYTNYINNPLLTRLVKGLKLNTGEVAALNFNEKGTADIIVSLWFSSIHV